MEDLVVAYGLGFSLTTTVVGGETAEARVKQIQGFVDSVSHIDTWAVIDDDDPGGACGEGFMFALFKSCFVRTDENIGLTHESAEQLISILLGDDENNTEPNEVTSPAALEPKVDAAGGPVGEQGMLEYLRSHVVGQEKFESAPLQEHSDSQLDAKEEVAYSSRVQESVRLRSVDVIFAVVASAAAVAFGCYKVKRLRWAKIS